MAPIVTRYPLDPTGVSPDNLVAGEEHDLGARPIRAFATSYGGFYTESVILKEKVTGRVLDKDVDYYCAELYEVPTLKYNKEVCSVIVVTNAAVASPVEVTYQCVGGPYSTSQQALLQMIEQLDLDDRPVTWGNIIGKPDAFTPAHHLHDAGDIYGFEYVVAELERIRQAILMGDVASHDEIYRYIDATFNELDGKIQTVTTNLNNHIADHGNPHQVTPGQIGTYTSGQIDALINGLAGRFAVSVLGISAGSTLNASHKNKILVVNGSGSIVIPGGVFAKDDFFFIHAGAGPVTLVGSGVQLVLPYGQNNVLPGSGAAVSLTFTASNQALVWGATQYT